jgi:hypothetical protein
MNDAQNEKKERRPRDLKAGMLHNSIDDVDEILSKIEKAVESVDTLPASLKASLGPVVQQISVTVREAQATIKEYGKAQEVPIKKTATEQLTFMRQVFTETAAETLAHVAKTLQAATRLHEQAVNEASGKRWVWVWLSLGVGLLSGVVGTGATIAGYHHFVYSQKAADAELNEEFGRAFFAAEVDRATRQKVQDAVYEARKAALNGQ